jgi:hypothetical protein
MSKNRGPLLETRVEQAIGKLYDKKRGEGWSPVEVYCLLRSRPAMLANLHEESVIKGFGHFKGTFEDLYAMIIQVLFLRELALATLAQDTKKRRQRKPSPPVEDPTMSSKRRSRGRIYR